MQELATQPNQPNHRNEARNEPGSQNAITSDKSLRSVSPVTLWEPGILSGYDDCSFHVVGWQGLRGDLQVNGHCIHGYFAAVCLIIQHSGQPRAGSRCQSRLPLRSRLVSRPCATGL